MSSSAPVLISRCDWIGLNQVKVALCGEDKAVLPIKVEDAREGLDLEFCQIVPGSKDREGRHVSRWALAVGAEACMYVLGLIPSRQKCATYTSI